MMWGGVACGGAVMTQQREQAAQAILLQNCQVSGTTAQSDREGVRTVACEARGAGAAGEGSPVPAALPRRQRRALHVRGARR